MEFRSDDFVDSLLDEIYTLKKNKIKSFNLRTKTKSFLEDLFIFLLLV